MNTSIETILIELSTKKIKARFLPTITQKVPWLYDSGSKTIWINPKCYRNFIAAELTAVRKDG